MEVGDRKWVGKDKLLGAELQHMLKRNWLIEEESKKYIALQDMQTFKNQAKIMLPFLVMLLLIKVSNCA